MTAALIVLTAVCAPFAVSAITVVVLGWRSARDRYPERPGRDDHHDVTPVRAPLAIEGKS